MTGLADGGAPREVRVAAGVLDAVTTDLWGTAVRCLAACLHGAGAPALLPPGRTARVLVQIALAVAPDPAATADPDAAPAPGGGTAAPDTVRRAVAFMETHAAEDIVLADIAGAAFVTPRALQYAFRRHLDTTPLTHLRRVRLDGAHRDLLAADPVTSTVTEIAARWGFAHTGRFAASYREVYRAAPRTTLGLPA
ncbi:helix-turn-helix transcriptional regulator [Streptomyces sp. NRRL B-24484]|uniref:helix-turn-helix transcriptional regulator n=1 Tax=Streptomyces sp. NRRL B-24484 TaxID=1463833 RepID=UPI000996F696|nr:helix-turn-helix transcriptional regulator [Streptomyces sp. NRRL B-24484]